MMAEAPEISALGVTAATAKRAVAFALRPAFQLDGQAPQVGIDSTEGKTMARNSKPEQAEKAVLGVTDNVPEEAWYWAALGSIGVSAILKLSGKDNLAIFVGQWPPTFLLFGLYHRLTNIGNK